MVHVILLSCVLLARPLKKNKQNNLFCLAFVVLCLFSILRYGFGNDYFSYQRIFDSIHGIGDSSYARYYKSQILFYILNSISPSFDVFIGITSLFFLATIFWFVSKNCTKNYKWVALAVFLINPYLFLMNLSAIRQCVAMSLFIIAVDFAYKKKPIPYCLLILVATMFHTSAIILLPVYLILNDKSISKTMLGLITIVVGLFVVSPSLLNKLLTTVIGIVFSNTTYDLYMSTGNSLRATILTSIFFFYVLFNIRSLKGKDLMYAKLYLCGIIFSLLAYRCSMLTRITMYFDIFSIVVIPKLIEKNRAVKVDNFGYVKHSSNTICSQINRYVFPVLIWTIFVLRYYSFFTNTMWESFWEYVTIFVR